MALRAEEVIGPLSILLAAYEFFALMTKRPTITTLSTRRGTGPLVWAWFVYLGVHFATSRKS